MANNLDATLFINYTTIPCQTIQAIGDRSAFSSQKVYGNMDGKKLASIVQSNLINKLNTIDNGIIERPI